jgi:hypothetical protein
MRSFMPLMSASCLDLLGRENRAHAGDTPGQADGAGLAREHIEQLHRRRAADELGDLGRGIDDIGRGDRSDRRHARSQLGGHDPAHVERAGLHLLQHCCLVAELTGVEDGQR